VISSMTGIFVVFMYVRLSIWFKADTQLIQLVCCHENS